jgi:hypothetical protein
MRCLNSKANKFHQTFLKYKNQLYVTVLSIFMIINKNYFPSNFDFVSAFGHVLFVKSTSAVS